jgi:hypothetical protein
MKAKTNLKAGLLNFTGNGVNNQGSLFANNILSSNEEISHSGNNVNNGNGVFAVSIS